MKNALRNIKILSSIIIILLLVGISDAQKRPSPTAKRNSPFAPNPQTKVKIAKAASSETQNDSANQKIINVEPENQPTETAATVKNKNSTGDSAVNIQTVKFDNISIANSPPKSDSTLGKTPLSVKRKDSAALPPSAIYKIGVGDILFISLENASSNESTYYTVLPNGEIDYPLAGAMVAVKGLTTDEIENVLQKKIKLYENPQVSVKIREHNSHTYTVLGMVEKPGEKVLQREAYPLLIVRAEAVIKPTADRAIIKRSDSQTETLDLKDEKSDDVLIFPGDIVEFGSTETAANQEKQFYYVGGEIISGGQKDFYKGITLTQAILASGGLKKQSVKKVVIRRRNEAGMLTPTNCDLKVIKDGKAADPPLEAGDTIEIGN